MGKAIDQVKTVRPIERETVRALRDLLSRCTKCGRCRSVCPVFGEIQRETAVARGKMALLEAGLQTPNPSRETVLSALSEKLSLCLLCGRCSANCPNGTQAHEAVRLARAVLVDEDGLPLSKRLLSRFAGAQRRGRDRLLRGAAALQRALMAEIPDERGLRLRLPFGAGGPRWVPRLASPFFLDASPETSAALHPKSKVGLFVGCAIHYLAPEIGEATVQILNRLGHTVVIPRDQACCGLMAHGMGDEIQARKMAAGTLEAFDDPTLEVIVAPCASCAAHLKKGFPEVLGRGTGAQREAGLAFGSRVRELSEFLAHDGLDRILAARTREDPVAAITYHDPCHLSQGLGIRREPRRLLSALKGYVFREMPGGERCCGMGGSFRLYHPGISRRILENKVRAVEETGAEVVATGCMGCWMQLKDGVSGRGGTIQVRHLAEILRAEMEEACV